MVTPTKGAKVFVLERLSEGAETFATLKKYAGAMGTVHEPPDEKGEYTLIFTKKARLFQPKRHTRPFCCAKSRLW